MQNPGKTNARPNPLLFGYLHAMLLSLFFALICGLIFHFSTLSESHLKLFSLIIILLSVFWGGFKAAQNAESKGLLHGLGVGLLFVLSTLVITFLIAEQLMFKAILNRLLLCILGGALGGIIGAFLK